MERQRRGLNRRGNIREMNKRKRMKRNREKTREALYYTCRKQENIIV